MTRNFYARRMFMGAQGLGPLGLMEGDPLLIQAEQKLIDQADELVVLVDSSKFRQRSSLILCGLARIATVITDAGIEDREAKMLEDAGMRLIVAEAGVIAESIAPDAGRARDGWQRLRHDRNARRRRRGVGKDRFRVRGGGRGERAADGRSP